MYHFSSRWIRVNKDPIDKREISFNDLVEGSDYNFRVCAVNEAGEGKPSQETGVFKAKDPYDKPGKPGTPDVLKITKNSADLSWAAPDKDGGAKIENYILELREKGDMKWRTANLREAVSRTEYTVRDLREGAEYEFRVTAVNKAGQGPASDPSKPAKYGNATTNCLLFPITFNFFSNLLVHAFYTIYLYTQLNSTQSLFLVSE